MTPRPEIGAIQEHEIRVISNDKTFRKLLRSEITRLNKQLFPTKPHITQSPTLGHASKAIAEASPTLVVLDPEVPSNNPRQSAQAVSDFLDGIPALLPVLVMLSSSDENWARETIRRPSLLVWSWDNKDCDLDQVLSLLLKPSGTRRLRAIIRLRPLEPVCDIHIGNASLFQNLRLKVKDAYRRDWRDDGLQSLFDMENQTTAWISLADKGNVLFHAILDEFGGALVDAREKGAVLDLRFEIDPEESDMFAMPIELLNREGKWQGFFCRTTAMARRVQPRMAREHRDAADQPLLLFVDAAATRGSKQVIGHEGKVERRDFRDLSVAVAAEREELEKLGEFCRLEVLKPSDGISVQDALRARLSDAAKPPPEIIHFTGHAISPGFGTTELIFPSSRLGEVDQLSVEVFASWLPEGVELVVLSACQGISLDTARFLHAAKGIAVLGFRCEVQARAAAKFLVNFYKERLQLRKSVTDAYRNACFMGDVASSAWAAAVLLDHN